MALNVGDPGCTTGLALRLYNARLAVIPFPADGPIRDAGIAALRADCHAIAVAVVAEITANGAVSVVVGAADAGLQTTTGLGAPTGAPAVPVTLAGTIA